MEWHGAPRVAFVVITKGLDYPTAEERRPSGARYTRDAIRGMLQFMGCKPRHAYKAAQLVFQKLEAFASDGRKFSSGSRQLWGVGAHDEGSVYVAMPRSEFYELVCSTLTEYNYKYAPSSDEIKAACSLKERRRHIIVLLCGTSGSGKSTLASILASRLGISTVLSTDSVRHMMRGFTAPEDTPLLFASTYEAGEALRRQQALDEARMQALQGLAGSQRQEQQGPAAEPPPPPPDGGGGGGGASAHELAIRGYKAQCELVSEQLEQLICGFEARRQSLVVEGVHLHVGLVMRLLQRHPGVVPFLVYIKSEGKHVERMAVRAKYMTLDPNKNKYVKNMRNIRWIQDYLFRKAEKHAIPCVENTNIDRSVGLIHLTLLGCLKRMMKGELVLDAGSSSVRMLHNEYTAVVEAMAGMGAAAAAAAVAGPAAAAAGGTGPTAAAAAAPATPGTTATAAAAQAPGAPGGKGSGSGGMEAALAAAAAAAAGGGSVSHPRSHPNSSPQLEFPAPCAACVEAAAALLMSSSPPQRPQQQQQQQQNQHMQAKSVLLQARGARRSSGSGPQDLPWSSPAPSPPHSSPLPALSALPVLPPHPASPQLRLVGGGGGGGGGHTSSSPRRARSGGPTVLTGTVRAAAGSGSLRADGGCAAACCPSPPAAPSALEPSHALAGGGMPEAAAGGGAALPPRSPPLGPMGQQATGLRVSASPGVAERDGADAAAFVEAGSGADGDGRGGGGGGTHGGCGGGGGGGDGPIVLAEAARGLSQRRAVSGSPPRGCRHSRISASHHLHGPERNAGADVGGGGGAGAGECAAAVAAPTCEPCSPQRSAACGADRCRDRDPGQSEHRHGQHGHRRERERLVDTEGGASGQQPRPPPPPQQQQPPRSYSCDDDHGPQLQPLQEQRQPQQPDPRVGTPLPADPPSSAPGFAQPPQPPPPTALALESPEGRAAPDAAAAAAVALAGGCGATNPSSATALAASPAAGAAGDGRPGAPCGVCGCGAQAPVAAIATAVAVAAVAARGSPCGGGDSNPALAPAPVLSLSPEQQQHVDAVLPACMQRLGAAGTKPAGGGGSFGGNGGSMADRWVGRWQPSPPPLTYLRRIEEGREGGDSEGPQLKESPGPGVATAAAAPAAAAAAADASADRAASAALAAAKNAYSRFGDRCSEEVLRAVMESAILDEQMDGVTEQQQQQQQQQPDLGAPAQADWPLGIERSPAAATAETEEGAKAGRGDSAQPLQGFGPPGAAAGAELPSLSGEGLGQQQQQQPWQQQRKQQQQHQGNGVQGLQERQQHLEAPAGVLEASSEEAPAAAGAGLGAAGGSPPGAIHTAGGGSGGGGGGEGGGGTVTPPTSAFAGASAWSAAAAAAMGAPTFLRTSSRRLGEESSSSEHSGYSSDAADAVDGEDGGAEQDGDGGAVAIPGGGAGGAGAGGAAARRRRPGVRVGSLVPGVPGDSDDADGDGYGVYGMYGGISPLQEYGSVYESATHDDMDEHGDEEEGVPLGRSNTLIRHLAGALERSRMRASASAAAVAASGTSGGAAGRQLPTHGGPAAGLHSNHKQQHQHRGFGPPPAASSGAALRLSVSRRTPFASPAAGAGEHGGAAGAAAQQQQQPPPHAQSQQQQLMGASRGQGRGDGARGAQASPPAALPASGGGTDASGVEQLRQLLLGGRAGGESGGSFPAQQQQQQWPQ